MVRCEGDEVDLLYISPSAPFIGHSSPFTVFNEEEYDPEIRGGTDGG